jgi:hypothetical protein
MASAATPGTQGSFGGHELHGVGSAGQSTVGVQEPVARQPIA